MVRIRTSDGEVHDYPGMKVVIGDDPGMPLRLEPRETEGAVPEHVHEWKVAWHAVPGGHGATMVACECGEVGWRT
jgi:hypothetical protein